MFLGKIDQKEMEKILVAIYDLKGITDRKGPNDPKGRLIFFNIF